MFAEQHIKWESWRLAVLDRQGEGAKEEGRRGGGGGCSG